MKTIKLYGELGKRFGKIHKYNVRNGAEAIKALCANYPDFQSFLINEKDFIYKVVNGNTLLNESELNFPIENQIKIIPIVAGSSGAFNTILGTALIIASFVPGNPFPSFSLQAGLALTVTGVTQLLAPTPELGSLSEKEKNRPSYLFNGPVNTTQQGMPVPLCYGELIIGSAVISGAISTQQIMAGYRYVEKPMTVDITALDNETNYQSALPDNYYRMELLSSGVDVDGHNYWIFRFYYTVEVKEAVPV